MTVNVSLGIGMMLLLIIGAICDHLCQEVPDSITVSFAMLGALTAAYNGRWIGALLTVVLTLCVQVDYQPRLFKWLSDRIVKRAYGDDDAVAAVEDDINQKSDALYEKYGDKIGGIGLFIFIAAVSISCAIVAAEDSSFISKMIAVGASVFAMSYPIASARIINKMSSDNEAASEHEELTAFGGADALIVIGLFGYFGLISGVYAITAIFLGVLVLYIIRTLVGKIKKKEKTVGFPLLPYLTICVPLGVITVIYLAQDTAELFAEVFPLLRLL